MNCEVHNASCKICCTLPSIMSRTPQETSVIFQRCQNVTLLVHDWWISIHFLCFCFWMSVTIMIHGSVKRNCKFGFILQSTLHVNEKRLLIINYYPGLIVTSNFSVLSVSVSCRQNPLSKKAAITVWMFGRRLLGKAQ